ncbi:hypothetical protein L218DRAFT_895575 [Marasmius fiardii PR-910]|nr:hypothetical protein L218DRAFT_895575 [Marasmius fiardii PR-910]
MRFAEEFDPTDNIKAILDAYPFSIGIFRELLQNSDDAGATKQVFLLDYRTHAQDDLELHIPRLAETQGPALLAYNNSEFLDEDWKALRTVHSSSKRSDTSKIGKYGIGFRSCYHITDYPQVISGNNLAIFDPQYNIFSDGGTKVTLDECGYHDVISAFSGVLEPSDVGSFEGTVFRFPLRVDSGSRISHKRITAGEIENLLKVFAQEELDISLLFLQYISQIEIYLVDEGGERSLYTTCNVSRELPTIHTNANDVFRLMSCDVSAGCGTDITASWLILSGFFPPQAASEFLSERLGFDVTQALQDNKLLPNMALAIQTDSGCAYDRGRLFTFLPLPILTAFPPHVHGLFSLTQSRQNLRNIGEKRNVAKGSNDLVLLEWNDLLFNVYLPKLWSCLFQVLSGNAMSSLMLQAWPKPQPDVTCGDSFNWKGLPRKLAEEVVIGGYKIWPAVNGHDCFSLKEIFLLSENSREHLSMLLILANAGINVSQIPQHLYELLSDLHKEHADITLLEPYSLAEHLKSHPDKLTMLSPPDKAYLLEYLLSDNQLENIVSLPIVPLPANRYATLGRSSSLEPKRTLLSEVDFKVFESFDQNAIALHILPKNAAQLLQTQGPGRLNVQPLDNARIVQYLGSVQVLPSDWTVRFWSWVAGSWKDRDGFFARVRTSNLQIIPCVDSIMRRITDVVFQPPDNAELEMAFRKFNISFASHGLSAFTVTLLTEKGCVKRLYDVHTLLENLNTSAKPNLTESNTVLSYFLEQSHVGLSQKHISKLYQLPIFPLLKYRGSTIDSVIGRISGEVVGMQTWTIPVVTQNGLLPPEGNISFLDLSPPNDNLLQLLKSSRQPLIISDLLRLSLRNFQSQPIYFQCAMVRYMANEFRSIPPDIIDQLKTIAFLPNKAGNLRAPVDLVDPHSSVAKLYPPSSEWFPSEETPLVEQVAKLDLFQTSLSTRLVDERIKYITSKNDGRAAKLARTLLELMESENFDCSGIRIDLQAKWLPLPGEIGLTSPTRSRDPGMYKLGRELFDEVLDVVESVPQRLRVRISCWSSPIPFSVLSEQFERVMTCGNATKMRTVIKEFSSRALKPQELDELKNIVGDKPWIPIARRKLAGKVNILVPTRRAVVVASRGDTPLFGFHELPSDIPRQKFFRAMGCRERPSIAALISSLHELAEQGLRVKDRLPKILVLLEALADEKLSDEERAKILVPDLIGTLHPAHEMVYNDIPGRVLISPDLPLAHSSVHLDLATKLQIPFLGHRDLGHIQNLADSNMEETFKTKIRKALVHYSDQQLLTEMLANALDAGASEFSVLLDEYQPPRWDSSSQLALLSPSMAQFYSGPSLVIHNDAIFEDKDFNNVINGIGGKHDRTDTIGQFALGALTMFHVTEMPMIISGDKVLFLDSSDPDKRHLSMLGNGPATILDWRRVARTYPDHFASLEGLFGFSSKLNAYHGTLFRLPLKQALDCSHVMSLIRPFENRAERCTLFTNIGSIEVLRRRDDDPHMSTYFAVKADRQIDYDDGVFISKQLTVTVHSATVFGLRKGSWRVVLGKDIETLPGRYHPMHKTHRIRSPLVVGLAANITESQETQKNLQKPLEIKSLFYTLPLPEKTTLAVHLTAPFILSEDRRNIRFDSNYNKLEASYNQWLLSELVPEVYYFLLEELMLRNSVMTAVWWPGQSDEHENTISGMVSRSFFAKLASTARRVFISNEPSPKHLTPKEAIISGREPSVVNKLLAKLETPNVVKFDNKGLLCHLCDVLREVDRVLLRNEILRATPTFISWYDARSPVRKILDLESLIRFMSPLLSQQTDHVPTLEGLPLIPLLDGNLGYLAAESSSVKYYYSFDPSCSRLLPAGRLIHPDFHLSSELAQKGLNVSKLEPRAIRELLHGRIPEWEKGKCIVTEAQAKFVGIFWEIYDKLPVDTIKELTSFALLPTTGGYYISIAYCQHSSVIFVTMGDEDWLLECATALGVLMIKQEDINPLFHKYIPNKGTFFNALFDFFQESDLSVLRSNFMMLDYHLHLKFAKWCRKHLDIHTHSAEESYWPTAANLPIWEVYSPKTEIGVDTTLESVAGIPMLSSTIPSGPDIIAFMCRFMDAKFTPFSGVLLRMKHPEINRENLLWHLQLPDGILNPEDVEPYESLLRLVLQGSYSGPIRVPNRNRVMTATASLYAHDDLFLAAFPDDYFCHQRFKEFESLHLRKHGLKVRADLDVPLFTNCAQAFDRNLRIDPSTRIYRAQTLFQVYCEVLPLHAGSNPYWGGLDSLRFIPSTSVTGQRSIWREYVTEHPTIASPAEVVRDDLVGIAWTQRASLVTLPHQRILLANPGFGVPNVSEVVAHLEILAHIGEKSPSNPQLLQDLIQTYSWLDQHSKEATPLLLNCHERRLFLNVVDPSHNDWTGQWVEADRLFFNLRCDTGGLCAVRPFLHQFPSLLRASGVKELQDAPAPELSLRSNETIFEKQRHRFEEMRTNKELVDVKFVTSDQEHDDIWGHRSFLAAASDHFRLSFCSSGMEESRPASKADPVVILMTAYSAEAVKSVLDYIYTGAPPEVARSDDMDADADAEGGALGCWFSIMNLAQLWEISTLFEIVQIRIIEERMINPFTVHEILEEATQLNAPHLVSACEKYLQDNKEALRNVPLP